MKALFVTREGARDFVPGDLAAFVSNLLREPGVWPAGVPILLDLQAVANVAFSPLLLRHTLVNLIGHAMAYCRGTWVRVRLARAAGSVWQLRVANGGPGIPVERQRYLFELAPSGLEPRGSGGSGLGLYIARTCVHFHGSALRVRTRDRLTVFSFHVGGLPPLAMSHENQRQPRAAV